MSVGWQQCSELCWRKYSKWWTVCLVLKLRIPNRLQAPLMLYPWQNRATSTFWMLLQRMLLQRMLLKHPVLQACRTAC